MILIIIAFVCAQLPSTVRTPCTCSSAYAVIIISDTICSTSNSASTATATATATATLRRRRRRRNCKFQGDHPKDRRARSQPVSQSVTDSACVRSIVRQVARTRRRCACFRRRYFSINNINKTVRFAPSAFFTCASHPISLS